MDWIPCSERMPKTDGIYIVTVETCYGRNVYKAIYKSEQSMFYTPSIEGIEQVRREVLEPIRKGLPGLVDREVIAWMPYPEAYAL